MWVGVFSFSMDYHGLENKAMISIHFNIKCILFSNIGLRTLLPPPLETLAGRLDVLLWPLEMEKSSRIPLMLKYDLVGCLLESLKRPSPFQL